MSHVPCPTSQPLQAPLMPVTVAFLLGILLGAYAEPHVVGVVVAGYLSAGAALWGRRRTKSRMVAVLLLWLCLGALRMAVWERHPAMRLKVVLPDDPRPVQLHGLVVDDPVELFEPGEADAKISDAQPLDFARGKQATSNQKPETRNLKQTCVLSLWHRRKGDGWQPIYGRVRATVWGQTPTGSDPTLRYGDEIIVEGEWFRVPAPGNPGQYDWQAALARKRIHGLLRVRPFDGLVVLKSGQGNPLLAAIFRLRQRWVQLIQEHFAPRDAGLLLALLLGERAEIDEDLKEAFTTTGTIHLLVISGFNVGLIAATLELFFRLIGLPWRLRLTLLALGLGGYCVLTGLQPPVARATLMAWVVLGAYALDHDISWPNTLAAAALLILGIQPAQLSDPGFQLSFGAVMSLLVFAGRWRSWVEHRLQWLRPVWVRRYVAVSLSATSAVWVGLAPALAWYFHLVSPVSVLANLLLAPLMSALISIGTALLLGGTLIESVMRWGNSLLTWLLEATLRCVSWCHAIPSGFWFVGHPPPFLLIGYYLLLSVSLLRARLRWSPARVLLCWVAAFGVWLWSGVILRGLESLWLRVDILDVGHGDAIVVHTPKGHTLLIDAGTEAAGRYGVIPYLRHRGISTLEALVLTHSDADHLGGALPLLSELRVKRLLTNGAQGDTMGALHLTRLAASSGVTRQTLTAGMRLGGDPAVTIEVLHPPPGLVPGVVPVSNDNSIVLKLTKGTVSVLLCGDIEEAGLPWLLRYSEALSSTVVKVPHHGSRLGEVGERLFETVQPKIAILSVGRLHGLPASETSQVLQAVGAAVYSTRRDGAIRLRTDGHRLEVRMFKHPRRGTNFRF